mgnify:CR=1 FL=1
MSEKAIGHARPSPRESTCVARGEGVADAPRGGPTFPFFFSFSVFSVSVRLAVFFSFFSVQIGFPFFFLFCFFWFFRCMNTKFVFVHI